MVGSKQPTIILCSGAWHTEFHIRPVILHFENAGYRLIPCPLAGAGTNADSEENIHGIQSSVEHELNAGNDVCLILHSAAGLIGSEAINRVLAGNASVAGRITRAVYLACLLDWTPLIEHLIKEQLIELDIDKGISRALKPKQSFFNELTDAEAQPFIDALTWQNNVTINLSSDAFKTVPKTFIVCLQDGAIPVDMQRSTARDYDMEVVEMDIGHCPFTTAPGEFVKTVDDILK